MKIKFIADTEKKRIIHYSDVSEWKEENFSIPSDLKDIKVMQELGTNKFVRCCECDCIIQHLVFINMRENKFYCHMHRNLAVGVTND